MTKLAQQTCTACQGDSPPLSGEEIAALLKQLTEEAEGWQVVNNHHLYKEYKFPNFQKALEFVNHVGSLAEEQGHHPDICLGWGYVTIKIWTHKIAGLHRSDFILASKIDAFWRKAQHSS